jgi:hypothetical protein
MGEPKIGKNIAAAFTTDKLLLASLLQPSPNPPPLLFLFSGLWISGVGIRRNSQSAPALWSFLSAALLQKTAFRLSSSSFRPFRVLAVAFAPAGKTPKLRLRMGIR